jgi:hypothetical protein
MLPTVGSKVNYKEADGTILQVEVQAVDKNEAGQYLLVLASENMKTGVAKYVYQAEDASNPEPNTWWF